VTGIAPSRPDNHHHASSQSAKGQDALLAIVEAIVDHVDAEAFDTPAASAKSKPRSARVFSRFASSKVIRTEFM
jgi:hypothetical protein